MGLRKFIDESMRVLRITKKPDKVEYQTVVKVAGLGILFIGLIGFILSMIGYFLQRAGF